MHEILGAAGWPGLERPREGPVEIQAALSVNHCELFCSFAAWTAKMWPGVDCFNVHQTWMYVDRPGLREDAPDPATLPPLFRTSLEQNESLIVGRVEQGPGPILAGRSRVGCGLFEWRHECDPL
jgi:hypothetical protein